ncbi:MAG TPA: hypothetical protein VGB55_02855 [Tepidisphaeraceae bacterium]|jgi:hypothetical protein
MIDSNAAYGRYWPFARSMTLWAILGLILLTSVWGSYRFSQWTYKVTEPIHFPDIKRGWTWGSYTFYNIQDKDRSFLDTYDDVGIQSRRAGNWIDYSPLRLAVVTGWVAWNHHNGYPYQWRQLSDWRNSNYTFHAPFLNFNFAMEVLAAAGAFMLVRRVVRVAHAARGGVLEPITGAPAATAAAVLLLFNPAMAVSAHGWPSGDMWVVTPFLWAVYLAFVNRWFAAGVVVAIGALLKGQQLFMLPVLLLWPMFQGRFWPPLYFLCGFVGFFGLSTIGWTLTYVDAAHMRHLSIPAISYVLSVILGIVGMWWGYRFLIRRYGETRRNWWLIHGGSVALLAAILAWPMLMIDSGTPPQDAAAAVASTESGLTAAQKNAAAVLIIALLGISAALHARPRLLAAATVALAGAAALMSMHLFNTSFAWFDASYLYGTDHWEVMVMGKTSNLPGLLERRFGWKSAEETLFTVGPYFWMEATAVTVKTFLFSIFAVLLVFASAGIALHEKRRSVGFLTAIVTPWLLFFSIPAQIHERYLLFGACAAAVCIGHRIGLTLLGLFLTAVTWVMTVHVMFEAGGGRGRRELNAMLHDWYPNLFAADTMFAQKLYSFIINTFPDIGWAVLLVTAVFFYITMTPQRLRPLAVALPAAEPAPTPLLEEPEIVQDDLPAAVPPHGEAAPLQ